MRLRRSYNIRATPSKAQRPDSDTLEASITCHDQKSSQLPYNPGRPMTLHTSKSNNAEDSVLEVGGNSNNQEKEPTRISLLERPEAPEDSKEPQESVASSFLVNTVEEEVLTELSSDSVSLQSLKAEFMYKVTVQRRRTLKEVIDLGMHRFIYEETLRENDEKPDPGSNNEVAKIVDMYPDK
ncbi:hypothetical protein LIER_36278 [Lithospermum erythrorhizon]|uniref:Uncharacterized protein n=1 Tax=Lithospermum erythrorhizon TaxID=34254 RepID=A0AAV3P557_LITER